MHPGSVSDLDIREKNSMWLAGFRKKNIKGLLSEIFPAPKIFFKKTMSKKIQFSEAEVATSVCIPPISSHVHRFTGKVHWIILNYWPTQNIDLLTSTWVCLCKIYKWLTHAVPTSKR